MLFRSALDGVGRTSGWTLYEADLLGLSARPDDLTGVVGTARLGQAHFNWTQVPDADVRLGGAVRVRHSPLTSGATWENASDFPIFIAGGATEATLPLVAGTYLFKAEDAGGRLSVNAAALVMTAPELIGMNVVVTRTENPSWSGAKTGVEAEIGRAHV